MEKLGSLLCASQLRHIHKYLSPHVNRPGYIATIGLSYLQVSQSRSAGHSQWANRRHGKALKDAIKSNTTNYTSIQIMQKVREGGPDPKSNYQLAKVIEVAGKNNVPSKAIQKMIERAVQVKDKMRQKKVGIQGPSGSLFICEYIFPPTAEAKATRDIGKVVARTFGGTVVSVDGMRFQFEEKGIINARTKDNVDLSLEDAEDIAITVEAEEIKPTGDDESTGARGFQIVCESDNLYKVVQGLDETSLEVLDYSVLPVPNEYVDLSSEDKQTVDDAINQLRSLPETTLIVENVYDNINW